ncbi:MAG TPA: hypothetical protein VF789_27325 [Thermoanaerobaculia bacterium]
MPNAPEPQLSLKTIVDAIDVLETHYGAISVTGTDRVRQKATLKFLASLKELVQSFCLQGAGDDEGELGYLNLTGPRGQ